MTRRCSHLQVCDGEAGLRGPRMLLARPRAAARSVQPFRVPSFHGLRAMHISTSTDHIDR